MWVNEVLSNGKTLSRRLSAVWRRKEKEFSWGFVSLLGPLNFYQFTQDICHEETQEMEKYVFLTNWRVAVKSYDTKHYGRYLSFLEGRTKKILFENKRWQSHNSEHWTISDGYSRHDSSFCWNRMPEKAPRHSADYFAPPVRVGSSHFFMTLVVSPDTDG